MYYIYRSGIYSIYTFNVFGFNGNERKSKGWSGVFKEKANFKANLERMEKYFWWKLYVCVRVMVCGCQCPCVCVGVWVIKVIKGEWKWLAFMYSVSASFLFFFHTFFISYFSDEFEMFFEKMAVQRNVQSGMKREWITEKDMEPQPETETLLFHTNFHGTCILLTHSKCQYKHKLTKLRNLSLEKGTPSNKNYKILNIKY